MPVPTLITELSTTAASNSPPGTESPAGIDDYQRAHAAFIAQLHANTVAATTVIVASAASTAIGAAASENVDISGTTTITGFGTVAEGINRKGRFTGVLTLTHNTTSLILPGNTNITTAVNDRYEARSLGAGNWIVTKYERANGGATNTVFKVGPEALPAWPETWRVVDFGNRTAVTERSDGATLVMNNLRHDGTNYVHRVLGAATRLALQTDGSVDFLTSASAAAGAVAVFGATKQYLPAGSGAVVAAYQSKLRESLSVFDFMTEAQVAAVVNNTVLDVTAAVQFAIDYAVSVRAGNLVFPAGDYRVTQITLHGAITYSFDNAIISGISTTVKTSVVQIKSGQCRIRDLQVSGNFSLNYECGAHWYTNNTATNYPGYNNFDGIAITSCRIGMVIGARPNQPSIGTAPDVDGIAINAPLSESYIKGLKIQDCIRGLYMRQPNGKVTLLSPHIAGVRSAVLPLGLTDYSEVCALTVLDASELAILGGSIENITDATGYDGKLMDMAGTSYTTIDGAVMETAAPIWMRSNATVRMSNIHNHFGLTTPYTLVRVENTATGAIYFESTGINRSGTQHSDAGVRPIIEALSTISDRTTISSAPNFRAHFSNSVLRDFKFGFDAAAFGASQPTLGVNSTFKNCVFESWNLAGTVRNLQYVVSEDKDALGAVVDTAGSSITAYGNNGNATSGGWVFAAGANSNWGSITTGLPVSSLKVLAAFLRLNTLNNTTSVSATSPAFAITPGRTHLITGFVRALATANTMVIRVMYFKFDGTTAASVASYNVFSGQETQLGTIWTQAVFRFVPPPDAMKAKIFLSVDGATFDVADLSVR